MDVTIGMEGVIDRERGKRERGKRLTTCGEAVEKIKKKECG